MKIQCPKCGNFYDVDAKFDGQLVNCAKCGEEFVIVEYIGDKPEAPKAGNPKYSKPRIKYNAAPAKNKKDRAPFACHVLNAFSLLCAIPFAIGGPVVVLHGGGADASIACAALGSLLLSGLFLGLSRIIFLLAQINSKIAGRD